MPVVSCPPPPAVALRLPFDKVKELAGNFVAKIKKLAGKIVEFFSEAIDKIKEAAKDGIEAIGAVLGFKIDVNDSMRNKDLRIKI